MVFLHCNTTYLLIVHFDDDVKSSQSLVLHQDLILHLDQSLIEYQTLRRRIASSISTIKEHMVPCRKNTMCFMMVAF